MHDLPTELEILPQREWGRRSRAKRDDEERLAPSEENLCQKNSQDHLLRDYQVRRSSTASQVLSSEQERYLARISLAAETFLMAHQSKVLSERSMSLLRLWNPSFKGSSTVSTFANSRLIRASKPSSASNGTFRGAGGLASLVIDNDANNQDAA